MRLYIDPGTGSMLFAILIGLIGAVGWALKGLFVKLRFLLSGGKYTNQAGKKIPLVIFSDDKRYWSVFEPVCEELDARGFDTVYMTASPDDPALKTTLEHIHPEFIGEGNKAFAKLNFLSANVLLSTTPGLDVYQWKRSKNVDYYVHMQHAAGTITGYHMFGLDYYDAVMLSGDFQACDERKLEELRSLPQKELVKIGIPYMDKMAQRLADNPEVKGKGKNKTILVAPTWGKSGIFSKFGGKILDVLLKTDYQIIVRPHPQSFTSEKDLIEGLMKKYPDSDRLQWNRDPDNFEVLKRSDLLISDYSGVVFDFSLVYDKPVIYADTEYDSSPYDQCWLDTPYWILTALPRIGEKLTADVLDDLPQMIEKCLVQEKYIEKRQEVRDEVWCNRGQGAIKAADYLIEKYGELTQKEQTEAPKKPTAKAPKKAAKMKKEEA